MTTTTIAHPTLTTEQVLAFDQRQRDARKRGWVFAEQIGDTFIVGGDTYRRIAKNEALRTQVKAEGGAWSKPLQAWVFSGALPECVRGILHDVAKSDVATIEPVSLPPSPASETVSEVQTKQFPHWFTAPTWYELIELFIQHRPAIAVVGPAGNGKTTTVEVALEMNNIAFVSLSCTDRTEVLDLVGGTVLTTDGEQWRDGLVTRAFREGKAVVLDEADTLDPRVMMALQNALQDAGPDGRARFVNTPEGRVYPSALCPIILCMNTHGGGGSRAYNGRNKLDAASLDRLSFISTTYENEIDILTSRGYKKNNAEKIVAWATVTRKKIDDAGMNITLSPRTLLRMAQAMEVFKWDLEFSANVEFLSRLESDKAALLR